jgi:hypothetical protein
MTPAEPATRDVRADFEPVAGALTPRTARQFRYVATSESAPAVCPRQDSNLRYRLRRAVLYPLSYEGEVR